MLAIRDRIDLTLFADDVLVDQIGASCEISLTAVAMYTADHHRCKRSPSRGRPTHRRAHEHRITDAVGDLHGLFDFDRGLTFRLRISS